MGARRRLGLRTAVAHLHYRIIGVAVAVAAAYNPFNLGFTILGLAGEPGRVGCALAEVVVAEIRLARSPQAGFRFGRRLRPELEVVSLAVAFTYLFDACLYFIFTTEFHWQHSIIAGCLDKSG